MGDHDPFRPGFEQLPVGFLTAIERCLGLALVGDVPPDRLNFGQMALTVENRVTHPLNEARVAILAMHQIFAD